MLDTTYQRWLWQKPGLGATIDRAHPLARGIVAYLPFNEGSGLQVGNLADTTLNGSLLNGGMTWASGPAIGPAVAFNTAAISGQHLETASFTGLAVGTDNLAVSFWAKGAVPPANKFPGLFIWNDAGDGSNLIIYGNDSGTGTGKLRVWCGGLAQESASVWANSTWHFVVFTRVGGTGQIWLDGVLDASASQSGTVGTASQKIRVGSPSGFYDSNFTSANYTVWNRGLSLAEIGWLFREPFAFLRPSPVRAWFTPAAPTGPSFGWEEWNSPILHRIRRESRQVIPWE